MLFRSAIGEMFPEIPAFPEEWIVRDPEQNMTFVKGLAGQFNRCYEEWLLPSESGASWAVPAIARDLGLPV